MRAHSLVSADQQAIIQPAFFQALIIRKFRLSGAHFTLVGIAQASRQHLPQPVTAERAVCLQIQRLFSLSKRAQIVFAFKDDRSRELRFTIALTTKAKLCKYESKRISQLE